MTKENAIRQFEYASKLFKLGVITSEEMFASRLSYDTYGRKW